MQSPFIRIFVLILIAGTISLAATCGKSGKDANVQVLDLPAFEKTIADGQAQLIDVRTPAEFAGGHVANAVNMDVNGSDFSTRITQLDKTKPVVVYCLSGGRSSDASEQLLKAGFTTVYNFEGGMLAWRNAGKPEDKATATSTTPAETAAVSDESNELKPVNMTVADYTAKTASKKYVLVDYNASWCGPCRMIKPFIHKIAGEHKSDLLLLDIDVDQNQQLAGHKNITSIPFLELYQDGKLIWTQLGALSEAEFRKATGL